nr:MAG TPA: hypothetical protein [Caudoviricetes sp.]
MSTLFFAKLQKYIFNSLFYIAFMQTLYYNNLKGG